MLSGNIVTQINLFFPVFFTTFFRVYRTLKFSGGAPFSTCAVVYKLQKVVPVPFV